VKVPNPLEDAPWWAKWTVWLGQYTVGYLVRIHIRRVQRSRESPRLYDYLNWKYQDACLLRRGEYTYPVAVYAVQDRDDWRQQAHHPNSVLPQRQSSNVHHALQTVEGESIASFLARCVRSKSYRWMMVAAGYFANPRDSRKTFAMAGLDVDSDRLTMTCYQGSYFDVIDSCESLEWELLHAIPRLRSAQDRAIRKFDRSLRLRAKLHSQVADPITNGEGRCAGIGISTLIAYRDGSVINLMIKKRSSSTVASHPGGVHVIPSGMFQEFTDETDKEFNVIHTIRREYLEELFSVPESEYHGQPAQSFFGDPRMQYVSRLITDGKAKLYFTGVGVNLLTLRPEICTLLWIDDPKWWRDHSRDPNFQHIHYNEEFVTGVGAVIYRDSDRELIEMAPLAPSDMVPSGAAAFWLGVDVLRCELQKSQ